MIGLDTNVVIGYVTQDDRIQSALADRVFDALTESEQGYVSAVTLVEIDWFLRRAYGASRIEAAAVLTQLLEAREICVDSPDSVRRALNRVGLGADFADTFINDLGTAAGCSHTVTFDQNAAEVAGMRLIKCHLQTGRDGS